MLAEVAAVGAVPFVVLLDQDVPGQAQQRRRVGEGADDIGAALEALMSRGGVSNVKRRGLFASRIIVRWMVLERCRFRMRIASRRVCPRLSAAS